MEIRKLTALHRHVLRLRALGTPMREICENLGLNYETWRRIENSALFQHALKELQDDLDAQLVENDPIVAQMTELLPLAVETHRKNMQEAPPAIRQRAAESILDRLGYAERRAVQQAIQINISVEKLRNLAMVDPSVTAVAERQGDSGSPTREAGGKSLQQEKPASPTGESASLPVNGQGLPQA